MPRSTLGPLRKADLFRQLYGIAAGDRSVLATVLVGHLVIEFLLSRLASQAMPKSQGTRKKMTHAALVEKNVQLRTIEDRLAALLRSINNLRNQFAHEIGFSPKLEDWRTLFREAERAITDPYSGLAEAVDELNEARSLDAVESWVFAELFIQTSDHLHDLYVARGGQAIGLPP
jgi:hypothetical protein